ncbi:TonB-dependent siderophore receptor [Rhizobiaceae bacterium n13]|uniref:TonB-dependent siderophore receptor n=1 Tax=Ferirhizobium litorale TaxID=2927786 RepID=A0AAE3QF88_9HYPH|nr:TonB-dependent siderophore receptor [Fererhizobium litorale]MDI7861574.1 TonB-dependent siderophore receptor [Fererhizobium litorale]MDI7922084.1 TonB-dependent siderophore receptor [Fererhizobium litorale]
MVGAATPFAAAPALAQEGAAPTLLAPIVVENGVLLDPTGPVDGYVAKTSVTATKTGTPLLETQQSISVVTADEIAAQGANTLGQALGYTPGVFGEPYGADSRFDSPRIRGFDGRQSQFLNGLRLMRTAGAAPIDVYGLERIEVLRGPASVMYGQANPGGIINLVSKRPIFERFGEVGVQAGSYDTYGTFFDFGDATQDSDFAYRLTGIGRVGRQQVEELENDRYYIAPAFTWAPGDDTTLTILTSFQHDNPSSPSGLPVSLTLDAANPLGPDFYVGDRSFDRSSRNQTNLGYEFEHHFDDQWTFRQNFRYSNLDWDYQALGTSSLTGGLMPDGEIRRNATFQDERLNTVNVDTNVLGEFATGEVEHTVLLGLDYRHFDNNVGTQFFAATPLDPRNPVYGAPITLAPTPSVNTFVDSSLRQIGLYAQDEIAYENWRATFGLRQDWAKTDGTSTNRNLDTSRPLDQSDHKLTGRAGLSYIFDNGVAPYISYSTSFEPVPVPTNGIPLKPTTGEQVEAGVKYQPESWNGLLTAAVYDLRQENVPVQVPNGTGGVETSQIGEVRVQGIELEAVASLADGLDLRAAYTYTSSEIVGGTYNGNELDNVPRQAASLWLDYTFQEDIFLEGFGAGGGVRYIGKRYGNNDNTYELDAVALLDAAIHYQKDNVKASLNFANLTDKEYLASCGTFGCTYGNGRTVMGRLSFSW